MRNFPFSLTRTVCVTLSGICLVAFVLSNFFLFDSDPTEKTPGYFSGWLANSGIRSKFLISEFISPPGTDLKRTDKDGYPLESKKIEIPPTTSSTHSIRTVTSPISTSINPTSGSSETQVVGCKLPNLLVDDPQIRPYLKHYGTIRCAAETNWVYSADGKFHIKPEILRQYPNVSCTYVHLIRNGDDTYREEFHYNYKAGSPLLGEAFVADCHTADGKLTHRNLHVGVPSVPDLQQRHDQSGKTQLGLDVYIYLLDSMSRVNFMRKLPKFYDVLTGQMGAAVMEGFNVVGDGTPWTLIPMLTGHFQTELPEGRKRFTNASHLDAWPLVWKHYRKAGYITSFAEEQPQFSFFSYKLKGFKDPPVDHYLRVFEQAVNWETRKSGAHKPYCLGDRPRSLVLCDWWAEQQQMYERTNVRTFATLFSSETSHDDYNLVETLDEPWAKTFGDQFRQGRFNRTLLIVMGDHGRRFGQVRQTQTGKTEEKLPFLALVVPDWFKQQYPTAWKNLQTNTQRLVTPFDLHATLMNVIDHQPGRTPDLKARGISLFDSIPLERTCTQAAIKPHFCSCLDWEELSPTSSEVAKTAQYVISQFNQLLLAAGNATCVNLTVDRILSARKLRPQKALLAFKESADYDNIFPDLSADANATSHTYQLRFVTAPSGGDFELSVNYYVDSDLYSFSFDDVSRLNMYGDQPHCIMNSHQHLRAYCFCADLLKNRSAGGLNDTAQLGAVTLPQPDVEPLSPTRAP